MDSSKSSPLMYPFFTLLNDISDSIPRCISPVISLLAVVAVSVAFMMTLDWKRPGRDRQDELAESFLKENPPETEPEVKFDTITKTAADVAVGDVILVNYRYKYVFPETEDHLVNIYKNKTSDYAVAYNDYLLDGDVLDVF